jgi:hypothetical protein
MPAESKPQKTITHQTCVYPAGRPVTICYSRWTDGSVTVSETIYVGGYAHQWLMSPCATWPADLKWVDTVALRAEIDAKFPKPEGVTRG